MLPRPDVLYVRVIALTVSFRCSFPPERNSSLFRNAYVGLNFDIASTWVGSNRECTRSNRSAPEDEQLVVVSSGGDGSCSATVVPGSVRRLCGADEHATDRELLIERRRDLRGLTRRPVQLRR